MASSDSLEELLDSGGSSREFPNRLANNLMKQSTIQIQNLHVGTLERCLKALDSSLDRPDPHNDAFAHCLSALQRVCGIREVLPKSHKHSCAHLDVSREVIVTGYGADMHEGTSDRTKVHVKKLRDSLGEPKNPELFYHEVILLKRIRHPNIISFYGATLTPRQLILGRMEHGNLTDFSNQHPKANRLGLLNDVAEGLNYLHHRDVILGRIRGSDVFVDQYYRAQIADFTFAAIHSNQGTPRRATGLCNALPPRWTAPEVLDGKASPNKKADIYSFAMLMIEVFTGKIPFDNLRTFQLALEMDHGARPERPDDPLLTDDVWDLITKCWKSEAYDRPVIGEVLQVLTRSLLRSLHQFIESPLELQVALSQFYDSTGWMTCIEHLDKAKLGRFVNFLDDMLYNEELGEDIRQRTLNNLREVCGRLIILPDSCLVTRQISRVSTKPHAASKYVEVWEGGAAPEEGSGTTMDVCIKVLKSKKDVHKRLYGEVAVWAKLDHQNIVRCFGMAVDRPQIVTRWMPHGQAITYARSHSPTDRVSLLINVAHGLEYLHSRGVIHGNLKHENILLDSEGNARLCDIGFVALVSAGESGFDLGPADAGGCRWVAPEVFQKGKFTEQSDIFSYGFVAAEIFLGKFLWDDSDETEVRSRVSNGERPIRSEYEESHAPTVDLWQMFATCWGTDPGGRVSISEALGVLKHIPLKISYIWKGATDQWSGDDGQERINELDKILGAGMVSHKERPKILNRLCKLCDQERKLPRSVLVAYESLQAQSIAVDRGGFGDVYRGEYDKHPVAIKVMRFYQCYDRNLFLSKFCREAIMWRHLRHPNILPLLAATSDTFEDQEPKLAFVSRWMENGNINCFIKKNDVNRVRLLVDVAHGLEYLHSFNFVHGDLKGANVLINDDRHACLADFGLSTIASLRVSNDSTAGASANPETSLVHHSSGGTDQWMSPELLDPAYFKCDPRPTVQSDCYALGMVIYEVLCGKEPYGGQNLGRLLSSKIINDVRPIEPDDKAALGFTDGLWWTVKCCWLKDRDVRPDVKTMLSRLDYAAWAWDMRRSPRIPS